MENFKRNFKWYSLGSLALATYFIWSSVLADVDHRLKIAFLDIGQGDAVYIEAPNGHQMIIDGGPPGELLPALSKVLPFSDRSIDMIVVTNPDQDHFAGFIDLLDSYEVGAVLESGTHSDTKIYAELERLIAKKEIPRAVAERGMKIDLGSGAYFEILFPDRDVYSWSSNDGSIIGRLVYGDTSVMLTGDATKKAESYVLADAKQQIGNLKSDILKVGHHGSRTSSGDEFVSAVNPVYAVISDGKENKYGHPHKETLDTLKKHGVRVLRTDQEGTIIFESDGSLITR